MSGHDLSESEDDDVSRNRSTGTLSSLTVDESESSGDESFGAKVKLGNRKTRAVIYSDTDSGSDDIEERCLSPRTRMSITGVRPSDLTDDSSEIDTSEDEINETNSSKYKSANESDNQPISKVLAISTPLHKNECLIEKPESANTSTESLHSLYAETVSNPITLPVMKPSISTLTPSSENRYSTKFERSIKEKLSSTIHQDGGDVSSMESNSSVQVVKSNSADVISIEDSSNESNEASSSSAVLTSSTNTNAEKVVVSQKYYDSEMLKLQGIKSELSEAEALLKKIGNQLHDKGKQLAVRIESLRKQLRLKAEKVACMVIENDQNVLEEKHKQVPNWDDLSAAVNAIQPKHTGKQGLRTFNNNKALTVERLKDLHGSLESCPTEDVLAEPPKGLKVSLMEHQLHALAWMNWRESQVPRGGILADDMGLGKTLTMISLVLSCKNRREGTDQSDSDSENEQEGAGKGWSSKGRRDYYKGGTLVVCPASLIRQWENEVQNRTSKNRLTTCVHHGNNRDAKPRHLKTYDLVITTYNIVTREEKYNSALFGIKWKRIILDEAHVIRNSKSQCSLAVCKLRGTYRWVLTGTPIQNKEMDLYALLKFLKCSPFDEMSHWKTWIDNKGSGGQQRLNTLMKSLMLRRTKVQLQQKGGVFSLPEKSTTLVEVKLGKDEMNVYQKVMTYSRTLFAQFLHQRAERENDFNYTNRSTKPNEAFFKMHQKFTKMHHQNKEVKSHEILVLLLRLRQICCHPGLIHSMLDDNENSNSFDTSGDITQPEIDLLEQLNKLAIHGDSYESNSLTENSENNTVAVSKASAKVLQKNNPVFDISQPSSKMKMIFEILEKKILNTVDKAIIVSQWTSVLNILKTHLADRGIRTLSLNGTVPVKNRQDIINDFNKPSSKVQILLLSLTAGGIGLNLVGANNLFLIDLHWNPQLETQAQDRIYRVGQTKSVNIYKFMCKDTIEERIKSLQEKKIEVANGVLTGVKASRGSKLTIDDLKSLFGL